MATKKQQRRREKERRHEYEVVYVDDSGNEVEPPPGAATAPARAERGAGAAAKSGAKTKGQARGRRPAREIKPPSWRRVAPRALLLGALMFLVLGLGKHPLAPGKRVLLVLAYTALFVPTFYWIDRMAYRRYLRTSGQAPPSKKAS